MRIFKKILLALLVIALVVVFFIVGFFWRDANLDKYDVTIAKSKIPVFTAVDLPFHHQYDSEKSLPVAPAALIDIDNDAVDEVFFGGGLGQKDALFAFRNGRFENISSEVDLPEKDAQATSLSAVSVDFDNNGFTDLIVSREDGLHIYYNTNGKFTPQAVETPVNEKSTPSGITAGDIDRDGDFDIFLATYLKKELLEGQTIFERDDYGSTSELLLNNGDNTFQSITQAAGLSYIHNTFQGTFVDLNKDGFLDLVVVYDTGEPRIYKNNGDLTFTLKENPLTNRFSYPMGLAVGDYNNDGLLDFMFSNSGSTLPRFLAKGDIKDASKFHEKWILLRNEGDFKFTDVAAETKIADYEFSWGCTFADMNNDGLQDLMVAENYVDLLPNQIFRLPSRLLIQKEDHTFVPTEDESGVTNPHFAITSLVSDFNKDGYLDMIWVNIHSPSLAYLNRGGENNFIQIRLPETAQAHGAIVTVETASKTLTDCLATGEGLASDQTALLHFGLGRDASVKKVTIKYLDGGITEIDNPAINQILTIQPPARDKTKNAAVDDD